VSPSQITTNPNYRGHVEISPNNRYFVYADGTSFFWLGDTSWNLNSLRAGLDEGSNGIPFYEYVQDRKAKNFTVIQTRFFWLVRPNEGGFAFTDNPNDNGSFDELNPSHFQSLDTRIQEVWNGGFVIAAHPTWFSKQYVLTADAQSISRYILARYGAYNLVWSLSGEYQYSYDNEDYSWTTADWVNLGNFVQGYNAYAHPVTVHPSSRKDWENLVPGAGQQSSSGEFHSEPWLDHNWLQTGHRLGQLRNIPHRVGIDYGKTPVKPVVDSESWYEDHNRFGPPPTEAHIRWEMWAAVLNGAAGYTYGAVGLWTFYNPDVDPEPPKSWNSTTWYDSLDLPGGNSLRHSRSFLTTLDWWALEPHRDWVLINGSPPSKDYQGGEQHPHLAASAAGDEFVAYIPEGNENETIVVTNLTAPSYRAEWLNPRDGMTSTVNISNPIVPDSGESWTVPARPTNASDDWVLHLTASGTSPTMTPTPTETVPASSTSTPTLTPTATGTPADTASTTPTASNTPLPTFTSTPTATATNTPLPTFTPTPTAGSTPTAVPTPGYFIQVGESWRYFKGFGEASDPITAWRELGFDDSSWASGPTGIGYGDGDDATVLSDMRYNYISVFTRRSFTVVDLGLVGALYLEVDFDDGFVAYLNGTEVARRSMGAAGAPVSYDTKAFPSHEARRPETVNLSAYVGLLLPGENVLAIQGHNRKIGSSDFSIIPALRWE
jgi:hypothetical protein